LSKVIVTGAAGFLGYALASYLSADKNNVVYVVDNYIRGENDADFRALCNKENVRLIECDLNFQPNVMELLPADVDYVYHFAALNGTQNFYERPFEVARCCTLPTMFLLEKYSTCASLKRFVYAGSSEAYASTVTKFDWPVPTDEMVPLSIDGVDNERWSYGGSKLHGEIACFAASRQFGIPVSVVRFHNAYGPRMGDKHVIPDFLTRATNGVFELFGYENTRSFIYVEDAIRATVAVASAVTCKNEIVNVGGSLEISMNALANKIMSILSLTDKIVLHPAPRGSVLRRAPNISKLHELTNFVERWSLDSGLEQTIKFYAPSLLKG